MPPNQVVQIGSREGVIAAVAEKMGLGIIFDDELPRWSFITAGSEHLVLLLGALGLVFSISSGIWPSIIATLFPTRVRFSGIAFAYNLCVTILAGFAPLTASAMIERTGVLAAPAIYIAACTMLTFISTFAVARLASRPNAAMKIA
jgi:MFS transporter, MHS family, proline/betaine transporter